MRLEIRGGIDWIGGVVSLVVGFACGLIGGWDKPMDALLIFVIADVVLGVGQSMIEHRANPSINRQGLIVKAAYIPIIIAATTLDDVGMLGNAMIWRTTFVSLFCFAELVSITKHMICLGIPFPESWRTAVNKAYEALHPVGKPKDPAQPEV